MNKRGLWALVLFLIVVIVLICNPGSMRLRVVFFDVSAMKAIILGVFVALGFAIGRLMR